VAPEGAAEVAGARAGQGAHDPVRERRRRRGVVFRAHLDGVGGHAPDAARAAARGAAARLSNHLHALEHAQVVIKRVGTPADSPGELGDRSRSRVLEHYEDVLAKGGSKRPEHTRGGLEDASAHACSFALLE